MYSPHTPSYTNAGYQDKPSSYGFTNQPPPAYTNAGFQDQQYPHGFTNQAPPYYNPPVVTATQPHAPVVTTTPYVVAMPQPTYRDYMGLSILNLLLCCMPIGIVALLMSLKARDSLSTRDLVQAAHYSSTAQRLNILGIVLGCCGHVAWIAYIIYYSTLWSRAYTYNWND